jgi:hypothetical protein
MFVWICFGDHYGCHGSLCALFQLDGTVKQQKCNELWVSCGQQKYRQGFSTPVTWQWTRKSRSMPCLLFFSCGLCSYSGVSWQLEGRAILWTIWIQSTSSHSTYWRSTVCTFHIPPDLFLSNFETKMCVLHHAPSVAVLHSHLVFMISSVLEYLMNRRK